MDEWCPLIARLEDLVFFVPAANACFWSNNSTLCEFQKKNKKLQSFHGHLTNLMCRSREWQLFSRNLMSSGSRLLHPTWAVWGQINWRLQRAGERRQKKKFWAANHFDSPPTIATDNCGTIAVEHPECQFENHTVSQNGFRSRTKTSQEGETQASKRGRGNSC